MPAAKAGLKRVGMGFSGDDDVEFGVDLQLSAESVPRGSQHERPEVCGQALRRAPATLLDHLGSGCR